MKVTLMHIPQMPGDKIALKPIGRNADAYQEMLREIEALVVRADALGFYGYGTAEHHFHTEGYEVNSQPMLVYAKLAALTEQIKFIPLSLVPVSTNPLLIAEQVAVFDHLFQGRIEVALARGYQSRWMQVMAQDENVTSGLAGTESDTRNRKIYNEYVDVIKRAWTEDAFSHDGEFFQVPYPAAGIKDYPGAHMVERFGAPGEVTDGNTISKIGVVPSPYTKPYPQLWMPFTLNPETLLHCAAHGYNMMISTSNPTMLQKFLHLYQDKAAEAGREVGLGQGVCPVRELIVGDSWDEAFDIAVKGPGKVFYEYFQNFGFMENWRLDSDDPNKFPLMFDSPEELAQRWIDTKFILIGTADEVSDQIEDLRTGYGIGANISHLAWQQSAQGALPLETNLKQLEIIGTKILPRFTPKS